MRKTITTILGDLTGDEYVRLSRAAQGCGLALQVAGDHAVITQAGHGHAPNPFVDPSPLAAALRRAVQRSSIAITAESDPGNGRDVAGALLCRSPQKIDGKRDFTLISYSIDRKTGAYRDISDVVAERIEALRSLPTTIQKVPLMDWLTAAMATVAARKAAPLVLGPEMRVAAQENSPLMLTTEMRLGAETVRHDHEGSRTDWAEDANMHF
ncbi:hypothetical protein [Paracoccus sp. ME4]|uniref:hypothetical protein n=1 Tax=Paracoccus sp. ME4 TaxID=3138066 RepID=UPI00398B2A82